MKRMRMKGFVFGPGFFMVLFMVLFIGWFLSVGADKASGVYGDIVYERKGRGDGLSPAVFPHWVHRIRYSCSVCHPEPFKAKKGENPVGMESFQRGESCGVCHNGSITWGVRFETCSKCHSQDEAGR